MNNFSCNKKKRKIFLETVASYELFFDFQRKRKFHFLKKYAFLYRVQDATPACYRKRVEFK